MNIQITLPDGSIRNVEAGTTPMDVAKSISEGLARNVIAAQIDGQTADASQPIHQNATLRLLTLQDPEGKAVFWHSSAHLMAEALEFYYPKIKFGIGPALEYGYYYDVDLGEESFGPNDFEKIEQKMLELAKQKNTFVRTPISKADAIDYFAKKGDEYKLELLEGLQDGQITFYRQGAFTDLCRGPHLPDTATIKAVKLLNVAGAYWRGDQSRNQLTRIYGITFPKAQELKDYLALLEEAKKRDHRKIGREMELFTFSELVGGGLPLWLPKGTILREKLIEFMKKLLMRSGYSLVSTPHIGQRELFQTSGHWEKYGKDSFQPIQTPNPDESFLLKPMNCPHHIEIYKFKPHSYKELPLRYAEFGTVYRYEQSGELHGLTRVRGFTQDDAHIFCTVEQVKDEFKKLIVLVLDVFKALGFHDYTAQISLRDPLNTEKYIGSDADWDRAETDIVEACAEIGLQANTELGEAAFYGPKLDFMVRDAIGRKWQLGTIQVDYQLPERFALEYIGADNQRHRPVMIHRAPFGSLERFIAVLIENCAGNFPLWLSPDQISILPISERFYDYANQLKTQLELSDLRTQIDMRSETTGRKIRDAEIARVPYMLIIGEKEAETQTVSVRKHGGTDVGTMSISDFKTFFEAQIQASYQQPNG